MEVSFKATGWRVGVTRCLHCRKAWTIVLPEMETAVNCPFCDQRVRLTFIPKARAKGTDIYVFDEAYFAEMRLAETETADGVRH